MSFLAFFKKKKKKMICSFTVKMVHSNVVYDYAKTWLGKICFLSLDIKIVSANQNAVFFDHQYLWKKSFDILDFCVEIITRKSQYLRLLLSVFRSGVASGASHPVRMQDSLVINNSENIGYRVFLDRIVIKAGKSI